MEHGLSILPFTSCVLVVLVIGIALRYLRQPSVVAYIIAGVILGPSCLEVFTNKDILAQVGSIGVLFLLFFVGMEVSLPGLIKSWRVALIGTILQTVLSVGAIWSLGAFLQWPVARSVALGFVISLSSTAVVMKLLQESSEIDSKIGRDVLSVLLVQDLLIVPMLIILSLLGGETPTVKDVIIQVAGGIAVLGTIIWIMVKKEIRLPFSKAIRQDHEMEVFAALFLCFGLAVVTELCHLSSALGAFVAGIIISAAKEITWVEKSLEPFRILFVGIFFVSVGMLIDLHFLVQHPFKVTFLVMAAFVINTFLNAGIFKFLGDSLRDSLYAGALLAQIGELSFLIAAVGLRSKILTEFSYQATIATISLTLLLSPAWIWGVKTLTNRFCMDKPEKEVPR